MGDSLRLRVEKFDFEGDIPVEARERTVRADNPVTGHNMHHRVGSHRLTDRPCCLGSAYPIGNMLVGGHHTDRDVKQIAPYFQLERGAIQVEAKTRHLVITMTEQQKRLLVQSHGTAAESRFGKMSL